MDKSIKAFGNVEEFAPDDENLDKQYEVIHTFTRAFLTEMKKLIGE